MSGERYEVATIEQMALIPIEALPRFIAELPMMLAQIKALNELSKMTGLAFNLPAPAWIDDGKHLGKVTIKGGGEVIAEVVHDTRTGERVTPTTTRKGD